MKEFYLSTCSGWPSTNQEMLDIQEYIFFFLNYVPADSGPRCRLRYVSVTMPEIGMCCLWRLCCKRSDAGFKLKLDVDMLLLVDAQEVVICMSPNSNFHQLSVSISSAV